MAQPCGIPIRPGQLTESPGVRFADSALSRTPGMGYVGEAATHGTAFNRAFANTMGEDAERITPAVMPAARTRIGVALDNIASSTTIRQDAPFVGDLTHIASDALGVLADSEMRPLHTQIQNVLSKFSPSGEMSGEAYQALTRTGAPLDRLQSSSASNLRFYANRVRDALDDTTERSASPEVLQQFQQARGQCKAMKTIKPLVEKSTTGDVSPAGLMQAVRGSYNGMAYGGGGPLGDLARGGQRFLKEPPSSGTAERLQAGENVGAVKERPACRQRHRRDRRRGKGSPALPHALRGARDDPADAGLDGRELRRGSPGKLGSALAGGRQHAGAARARRAARGEPPIGPRFGRGAHARRSGRQSSAAAIAAARAAVGGRTQQRNIHKQMMPQVMKAMYLRS